MPVCDNCKKYQQESLKLFPVKLGIIFICDKCYLMFKKALSI